MLAPGGECTRRHAASRLSRIRRTTSALVRTAHELVDVMHHCAQTGLSARATKEGKAPIEAEAVLERTDAVDEAMGRLAASRSEDFSGRYAAFLGALGALAKLGADTRSSGGKGAGGNIDPYSEFAE